MRTGNGGAISCKKQLRIEQGLRKVFLLQESYNLQCKNSDKNNLEREKQNDNNST